MSFLIEAKKSIKLLASHKSISTSQFESHWEVGIFIIIVDGSKGKGRKKLNDECREWGKSLKSKLEKATYQKKVLNLTITPNLLKSVLIHES